MALTYWQPQGTHLTTLQAQALAIPALGRPPQNEFLPKWTQRVQALVNADPAEALRVRERTWDLKEELWRLVDPDAPTSEWGEPLTQNEEAQTLMRLIDWTLPGLLIEPPTMLLADVLEQIEVDKEPVPITGRKLRCPC